MVFMSSFVTVVFTNNFHRYFQGLAYNVFACLERTFVALDVMDSF